MFPHLAPERPLFQDSLIYIKPAGIRESMFYLAAVDFPPLPVSIPVCGGPKRRRDYDSSIFGPARYRRHDRRAAALYLGCGPGPERRPSHRRLEPWGRAFAGLTGPMRCAAVPAAKSFRASCPVANPCVGPAARPAFVFFISSRMRSRPATSAIVTVTGFGQHWQHCQSPRRP